MKTELIFFDNWSNSMKGTNRGLIAFITLIIFDIIYLNFTKDYYYISKDPINIYSAILTWLVICSAISVQIPKSVQESALYGALVGFSLYSVFNLTNYSILKEWKIHNVIMDTIWGTFLCCITAIIVYYVFWNK